MILIAASAAYGETTSVSLSKEQVLTQAIPHTQTHQLRTSRRHVAAATILPTPKADILSRTFTSSDKLNSANNTGGSHLQVYAIILLVWGSLCCVWFVLLFYCWRRHITRLHKLQNERPKIVNVKKSQSFAVRPEDIHDVESAPHPGESSSQS